MLACQTVQFFKACQSWYVGHRKASNKHAMHHCNSMYNTHKHSATDTIHAVGHINTCNRGGHCRCRTVSGLAGLTCSRKCVNAFAATSDSWPAFPVFHCTAKVHRRSRVRRHGSCTARRATACGSSHGMSSSSSCCRLDKCCSPAATHATVRKSIHTMDEALWWGC